MGNRTCPTCGSAYVGRTKFCSEACRPRCKAEGCERPRRSPMHCAMHAAQHRRGGPLKPSRWADKWECVVCGDPVEPGRGRRRHCSGACQAADSRARLSGKAGRPDSFDCCLCGKTVDIRKRAGGRLQRTDTRWCNDCGRESPDAMRFRRYGITPEEYAAASARGCDICGAKDRNLHVDHDHNCCGPRAWPVCGKCVRGLICGHCNRALGMFGDSVAALNAAIEYLNRFSSGG